MLLLLLPTVARSQTATPDSSDVSKLAPAARSLWLPRAEEGSIFREDRWQHASLSASLVMGASAAGASDGAAAGSVVALGILKEYLDSRRGSGASRLDLVTDVVGVGLGLLIVRITR